MAPAMRPNRPGARRWRPSLSISSNGFVEIGRRDAVIGRLQSAYRNLRPVLFHSPYEAACAFVIGHRIGPFFAQGILMRGAGLVDAITDDDLTPRAIQLLYGLTDPPDRAAVQQRAEVWRPYRMWAAVLLNVWVRSQPREVVGGRRLRSRPK